MSELSVRQPDIGRQTETERKTKQLMHAETHAHFRSVGHSDHCAALN